MNSDASPIGKDKRKILLVFSQTFVPDPASVGQHMADVAIEMAQRGHRVRVYAAARGYENPDLKFPLRENLQGADVRRLRFSSFGKKNLKIRAFGTFTFMIQCLFIGLFTRRLGGIFFSTSPPMIGIAASIIRIIRRVPIAYWAMDLNPDQLIAMKKIGPKSVPARVLETVNRIILSNSALIIALDRFMAGRLRDRNPAYEKKMLVMPPWPHETHMESGETGPNPFRVKHGLEGKFVIMYSGNHSPANPLETMLLAAERLKDDDQLRFLFVGGGGGKKAIEQFVTERKLSNCVLLPYQPLADLKYSLSAADVHIVSMGDNMVGIIHPCKIYGAMAVSRPILYLGPKPSHISDIIEKHEIGLHVSHGDVQAALRTIDSFRRGDRAWLDRMGTTARDVLQESLSQSILTRRFCDSLENALGFKSPGNN